VESARIDLAWAVLSVREGENEPDFELQEITHGIDNDDEIHALRATITQKLSQFDADELQPVETRCRRIRSLADGKGTTSLTTIVGDQLNQTQEQEFDRQPDPLCRSIWVFLNARQTFEDAESFHFARQFRDHGKMYDAFEIELEKAGAFNAASVDEPALAAKITAVLQLKTNCTVKALDLPPTASHPASIMLIVRHGGPLSSVHDHRQDGRRGTIYYRPPNEATLIYTPTLRQIEICADSPVVRQKVSDSFAEVVLGHNISDKPLTWKRYNLSRFRDSFMLPLPKLDGYTFMYARVLEAEVRLGIWRRKLNLKVTVDDDIEKVAETWLGDRNVFRRGELFSRIGIAVGYSRVGDDRKRTLNITIGGTKSCNLQSRADPDERSLGFALLKEWGILAAFRQIPDDDLRAHFEQLVKLYDRAEEEVGGGYLRDLGLDPERLIEGGLLERKDRQDVVLLDDGDLDGEGFIVPAKEAGMVKVNGSFGEDAGLLPIDDTDRYAVNTAWLLEMLLRLLKPLLTKRSQEAIDEDLTLLGLMQIDGAEVPVYFARRLYDLKTVRRLDTSLRGLHSGGTGIVLAASSELPAHLGPNVVVPLLSHLVADGSDCVVSRDGVELAWRTSHALARGGAVPQVIRSGMQSGTLYIPGGGTLFLAGNDQLTIFERLVAAHVKGVPDVYVGDLMEGFSTDSPQQAFRSKTWKEIVDVFIAKGVRRGYWRLIAAPQHAADPVEVHAEATV
jgi:hypothetical protein